MQFPLIHSSSQPVLSLHAWPPFVKNIVMAMTLFLVGIAYLLLAGGVLMGLLVLVEITLRNMPK